MLSFFKKQWSGIISVVLVIAAFGYARNSGVQEALARKGLADARIVATAAREDAQRILALKLHADDVARMAQDSVARMTRKADAEARMFATERARFAAAAAAAADTCGGVIAAAEDALVAGENERATLRGALAVSTERGDSLQVVADTTAAALGRLLVADRRLDSAAVAVVAAYHPSFFKALFRGLKPKLGVGAAVGFDAERKPRAVVGLTAGWVF